jgi:class 3 adenylate cyclase
VAVVKERWTTATTLEVLAPSRVADDRFRAWYARSARFSGGPDRVADLARAAYEIDLRPLLPSISCPTLVFGHTDALVDEIEEFLTGARTGGTGNVLTMIVLFTDIVASTQHQARIGPGEWSRLTDYHDAMVRAALSRHRGHEVKTMGDGFLATFDSAGRALRCATEILASADGIGLDLRAGVHTGEVEVRGNDIAGLAVTIAERVCDLAPSGEVLVSNTAAGGVAGSGLVFEDRGDHELKGVPGTWRLFVVTI